MTRRAQQVVIEVDDIEALPPGVEPCRDEKCPVAGVHAAHKVYRRGRKIRQPKNRSNI